MDLWRCSFIHSRKNTYNSGGKVKEEQSQLQCLWLFLSKAIKPRVLTHYPADLPPLSKLTGGPMICIVLACDNHDTQGSAPWTVTLAHCSPRINHYRRKLMGPRNGDVSTGLCREQRKPWVDVFWHRDGHVEDSKTSDPWDIWQSHYPHRPCWSGVAKIFMGVWVWVVSVCKD